MVVWFGTVAMYLSSSGTSVHHIYYNSTHVSSGSLAPGEVPNPPACGDNKCINPNTNTAYRFEEICDPAIFNEVSLSPIFILKFTPN